MQGGYLRARGEIQFGATSSGTGAAKMTDGWLVSGVLRLGRGDSGVAVGKMYMRGGLIGHQTDSNFRGSLVVGYKGFAQGLYDMSDGNAYFSGVEVGQGNGRGIGVLLLSGGDLTSFGAFNMGGAISSEPGKAEVVQTGGNLVIKGATNLTIGNSNAAEANYTISGGSLDLPDTINSRGIIIGRADPNTWALFHVLGSGATRINSNDDIYLNASGTLKFTVDTGGVTKITVVDDIVLYGTIDMDLAAGYTPAHNQVFDLIVNTAGTGHAVDANAGLGYTLAPGDVGVWRIDITQATAGSGGSVQAVYLTPEPGAMAILAGGAAALLIRRRRRP
jgi:hypothetical protein